MLLSLFAWATKASTGAAGHRCKSVEVLGMQGCQRLTRAHVQNVLDGALAIIVWWAVGFAFSGNNGNSVVGTEVRTSLPPLLPITSCTPVADAAQY